MRRVLAAAIVIAALAALWVPTRTILERTPLRDFASYWAAAILVNQNPYDLVAVHLIERSVGMDNDAALIMRNPPWALLLVAPLRWMALEDARALWFFLSVAGIGFATVDLWRQTSRARPVVTALLVVTFMPTIGLLLLGQITWLMLLGLALFVRYISAGRLIAAGAALSLLTIKPHLVLPLFLVAAAWSVREREWRLLGGLVAAVASACALLLMFTPQVFIHYAAYLQADAFDSGSIQTLGGELMRRTGVAWVRWLPPVIALGAAAWFWYSRRERWDWLRDFPVLIVAGVAGAPYGFTFDQSLLLGALIPALAVAPVATFVGCAALVNFAILAPVFNPGAPDPSSLSTTAAAWAVVFAVGVFGAFHRRPRTRAAVSPVQLSRRSPSPHPAE